MTRAILESKMTVCDMYGSDIFKDDINEMRRAIEEDTRDGFLDEAEVAHYRADLRRLESAYETKLDYNPSVFLFYPLDCSPSYRKRVQGGFWQMVYSVGPLYEGKSPISEIRLFPSLLEWLGLSDDTIVKMGAWITRRLFSRLLKWIERLGAFARLATEHTLSAIDDALAVLRRSGLVEMGTASSAPTLRELIGELISPHVLAAGGGFGLFVTRC